MKGGEVRKLFFSDETRLIMGGFKGWAAHAGRPCKPTVGCRKTGRHRGHTPAPQATLLTNAADPPQNRDTLAAAEAVGYPGIGIEKDEHYFKMACRSIPKLVELRPTNGHGKWNGKGKATPSRSSSRAASGIIVSLSTWRSCEVPPPLPARLRSLKQN